MYCFIFFTHPDSSGDELSLSAGREGEEGESFNGIKINGILTDLLLTIK